MERYDRITPAWPAPASVEAFSTTRHGGVSHGAYHSFNLGAACGDEVFAVAENRRRLGQALPSEPCWLNQKHGTRLIHLKDWQPSIEADAAWTDQPGQVCVVLTADCLPVLLAEKHGRLVAAVHAGWRGLAAGIIENVVQALPASASDLIAWIGPAISNLNYEVDNRVRDAFLRLDASFSDCFEPNRTGQNQHYLADLKAIALAQLQAAGVRSSVDAKLCTSSDSERFFSHRRDQGHSGRQASLIWIKPDAER